MIAKRFITRLLFFILFAFYTISPISYAYASQNIEESVSRSNETHSLPEKISICLWELICNQLVSAEDTADSDSTERVLLKKKRAIIPRNGTPIYADLEDLSPTEKYFELSAGTPVKFFEHEISKPLDVARSLHSGLSPPSA